jgi:pentatricopeptide repeat protein
MKKTILILSLLALIASSCGQATKKQAETTSNATDSLISKSIDRLHTAYISFDTAKLFEEIRKIEKLYYSGNSSKSNDFKYWIKYGRAEIYAISNNNEEALRLLRELKKEKPEYVGQSIYDCSFESLHSKPEFIRIAGNPLELYFALAKPVNDSIRKCLLTNRYDKALKYIDVKDSLYATLAAEDRAKISYMRFTDRYFRTVAYSMKGNINDAIHLLQEMKENGWGYAINFTATGDSLFFKNLKHVKEYEALVSETKCNCEEIFDWAVTEFKKNDAGFDYAVEMKGKEAYEKHTAEKQSQSKLISSANDCVRLVNEWLSFFRKSHIGFSLNTPAFPDDINTYDKFEVKRLSTNTMYIKIKSFSGNKSQQVISDMINTNDYLLSNTPNLVIDLRGNTGGLYSAWNPLRKYIDSKPVYSFDDMIRVSEENAKHMGANLVRDNAGKRFAGNATSITIKNPDVVQKFPESIVILTDNETGSSSESFLIYAKQSRKVKVMGQKTSGATEVGNITFLESPDKQFKLLYGMTITSQAKYTQYLDYGIQPDIFLPQNLDWVEAARKYLEY